MIPRTRDDSKRKRVSRETGYPFFCEKLTLTLYPAIFL